MKQGCLDPTATNLIHKIIRDDSSGYSSDVEVSAEAHVPAQRGRSQLRVVDQEKDLLLVTLDR